MVGNFFRFLAPKLFVIATLALAFWIGNAAFKEMQRGKRIQEEIASLQSEADRIQKENALLQDRIRYFQTDSFQEQEARSKLNYQSPDEQVVVVKRSDRADTKSDISDPVVQAVPSAEDLLPNYEKWWKRFLSV